MEQLPQYVDVREILQNVVRKFGLQQKDGAQGSGISVIQSHILYELNKRPNLSLNELADVLCVEASTLSRQVQQLVELELLSREPDPKDRRYVTLTLTEKGHEQQKAVAETMEDYILSIFQYVPEDKKRQVLESLQLLNDAMGQSPHCCLPPL
jgi:DNA-binding MarR family transcriptional regulator